jgi:hypothetical protein
LVFICLVSILTLGGGVSVAVTYREVEEVAVKIVVQLTLVGVEIRHDINNGLAYRGGGGGYDWLCGGGGLGCDGSRLRLGSGHIGGNLVCVSNRC